MKIRTQFLIIVALFCAVLVALAILLILTNREVAGLQKQEEFAHQVELGVRELSYLSNDYLLHGQSQQRARWEEKLSLFSHLVSQLMPRDSKQTSLVNNFKPNIERLKSIFSEVASAIENRPAKRDNAADMAMIRVSWSRMEVQNQGMAFDASQLARLLEERADRLYRRSVMLLFILIGAISAFLVISYVTVNRRILRAISELQAGTRIIGSGNLDFSLETRRADEIGDLSHAFNRMTADLKAVTASKADLEREINERRQAVEALTESEAKYRNLFENMTEEVHFWQLEHDEAGRIKTWRLVDANPPTLKTWGRADLKAIKGKTADEIFGPGATAHYLPVVQKIMSEGLAHSFVDYFPNLDKYFRFTNVPLGNHFITTGADITSLKKAEAALHESYERIKASLVEKEVLLKEIHHRVKNNMQVISSLVSLQANELPDGAMRAVLQDVTHRVRSMAMVHEKLYQSPDLARIDFDQYAHSLLIYLWRAHETAASGIKLALELAPVSLPVNEAVPCGLILNELFSNALKHAFHGRKAGQITVSLAGSIKDKVCLRVSDNGIGLPAGFDLHKTRSLGLHLVRMLTAQLHATVNVTSQDGTNFAVTFQSSRP